MSAAGAGLGTKFALDVQSVNQLRMEAKQSSPEALKAAAENTLEVTLTSASPVDDGQRRRIEETLNKRFNRQVRLTVQIDPQLIGGARLQVGDRVIDGSVRSGLDKLATALRV